jgi:hypothetical protein
MSYLKHLGLQFHSSNATALFLTVSGQRLENGENISDINRSTNNDSYVYSNVSQDCSVIRLPVAELLGLNSGKRSKSVSALYTFPFIPSQFVSSSYGRSLKRRKLEIDHVHQFGNEAYRAWNSVSTIPAQPYGWFMYRQTLLYIPFPFLIWDKKTHEEDKCNVPYFFFTISIPLCF